ncbi:citrate synthase [Chitinimonas koreensis]|uniref:citrate synthase n=1 Tax=Chitinimonas koreensis TaxID=356302 RepID=UPI00040022F6|nr:citrate synthase [Chitinimonas koreensis]QNM98243.1 citryl-CoA lyase [Chitinimonas koreensis]
MTTEDRDLIHSKIWLEEAQADNPFRAEASYCRGYDVYGALLGQASYIEYLYLLFRGERPDTRQARLLETLAIALANPGPRDPSVHAAMCAGVGGSPAAAALMAALAAGAGSYGGAREVRLAVEGWQTAGTDLAAWTPLLTKPAPPERAQVWPDMEHPPGFDPYGTRCAGPVLQTLARLAELTPDGRAAWLAAEREGLERAAGLPLALTGAAAAGFADLGCTPAEAEMLTLLLRLPGAAAHTLEQAEVGYRRFPFFTIELENDPQAKERAA